MARRIAARQNLSDLMMVITQNERWHSKETEQHGRELLEIAARVEARLDEISRNDFLTEKGKADATWKVKAEGRAAATAWRDRYVKPIEARVAQLRSDLVPKVGPEDALDDVLGYKKLARTLLVELRHGEIRRRLEGLDPLQLSILYGTADAETRAAIESGPPILLRHPGTGSVRLVPMVDPETVAAIALGRAEVERPEVADALRATESARGQYESLAVTVERELRVDREHGEPGPETIRVEVR